VRFNARAAADHAKASADYCVSSFMISSGFRSATLPPLNCEQQVDVHHQEHQNDGDKCENSAHDRLSTFS
jgi:hypothetical protein